LTIIVNIFKIAFLIITIDGNITVGRKLRLLALSNLLLETIKDLARVRLLYILQMTERTVYYSFDTARMCK